MFVDNYHSKVHLKSSRGNSGCLKNTRAKEALGRLDHSDKAKRRQERQAQDKGDVAEGGTYQM